MPGVFINYRVEDEAYAAALIDRELCGVFGPENVFRASRSIQPGDDYPRQLLDNLRRCSVLLAVVGREWLGGDGPGPPRLHREQDWVRRELAEAFEHGIRVIPILVAEATLPSVEDLPDSVVRLARCQYLRLHHRNLPHDIGRLVDELTALIPDLALARESRRRARGRSGPWRLPASTVDYPARALAPVPEEPTVTVLHLGGPRYRRLPEDPAGPGPGGAAGVPLDPPGDPVADPSGDPAAPPGPEVPVADLLDDLFALRDDHGLEPQLVVVSGDLSEHGLPSEFDRFSELVEELCGKLALPPTSVVVVPGDHDVNRRACSAYFDRCAAEEHPPEPPYVPKWDAFRRMTARLYPDRPLATFPPDQPWVVFEDPELEVAIAALNSTIADSHHEEDHYGWLGSRQLAWFAERMRHFERLGWLRIGVLHHDPGDGAPAEHRLRDSLDFERLLAPHLQLVLHGHGQPGQLLLPRLAGAPLLGLDGPAASPGIGQYQVVQVFPDRLRVWSRHYDPGARSWATAAWSDRDGGRGDFPVAFQPAHRVFPARLRSAHRPSAVEAPEPTEPVLRAADDLLHRVAEVCRLQHGGGASVDVVTAGEPGTRYLRVTSRTGAVIRQYPVGVCAGPVTAADVDAFLSRVDAHYRASDPGVQSVLVYGGEPAAASLRVRAAGRGLRLVSFPEYQGVYDLRPYATRQLDRLSGDPLYPADLYVPQRFTTVGGADGEQEDLLAALLDWLADPEGHFVLVLGDFGLGKTFLLRELARRMHAEMRHVVPILVELRALEKAHDLGEMIAAHLAAAGEQHIDLEKFGYLQRQGRVALLFDGFDELALRVTYDRAAEHLNTLLQAVEGRAKVVLTSRTQHFLSDEQVSTALGDRVAMSAGRKLVKLRGFDDAQVVAFLTKLLGGDQEQARARFELLRDVRDLLGLSRNPRMLGLVAKLDEGRLRDALAQHGPITAALLYRELLDQWLEHEYARAQPRGAAPTLSSAERWTAVTELALRLWASAEPTLGIDDLHDVAAALTNLADRQLDTPGAAHVIGSGTLLTRTDEGRFSFAHPSVMEWLVAADACTRLRAGEAPFAGRSQRELSPLMAEFFADLAGRDPAISWAQAALADRDADDTTKANALLVLGYAGGRTSAPARLSGRDLRGKDLTGQWLMFADLSGADLSDTLLSGADLSGADLRSARLIGTRMDGATLAGADLSAADLRGARLLGADLRDANGESSRWRRAALIGARFDPRLLSGCDTLGAALPGAPVHAQFRPARARYQAVALDPTAGLFATGGADGSVCLWDAGTGRPLRVLPGHAQPVTAVAFSPDGATLATASAAGQVCLWSVADGALVRVVTSHISAATAVGFSPDGTRLAAAGADGMLCLWRPESGEPVLIARDHAGAVTAIAFSRSSAALATASADRTVRLWNARTGEPEGMLHGHRDAVLAVAFTEDEAHIVTASADDTVRLWTRTDRRPFELSRLGGEQPLQFSPDGRRLVSIDPADALHVWEPAAYGDVFIVLKGHAGRCPAAAFSPDGARLATATTNDTARVWDPATGQAVCTVRGWATAVTGVTFSADGSGLVVASSDQTIRVWDAATGACAGTVRGVSGPVTALASTPAGIRVVTDGGDETLVWTPGTGLVERVPHGHTGRLTALALSTAGGRFATGSADHTCRIWDLTSGAQLGVLHGHIGPITGAAFAPDGTTLATASTDDTVRLWNTGTSEPIQTLPGHAGTTTVVAFSRDGALLATGSTDGTVQVWDAGTGRQHGVLAGHAGRITVVGFSPDGAWIATSSTDRTIRLWDAATGRPVHTLPATTGWTEAAAFSPDSTTLATGCTGGTVHLWTVTDGGWLGTLAPLGEGWATVLPRLRYKLDGVASGEFWYAAGMCRFEPGELDPYHPGLLRLPTDAPLTSG